MLVISTVNFLPPLPGRVLWGMAYRGFPPDEIVTELYATHAGPRGNISQSGVAVPRERGCISARGFERGLCREKTASGHNPANSAAALQIVASRLSRNSSVRMQPVAPCLVTPREGVAAEFGAVASLSGLAFFMILCGHGATTYSRVSGLRREK